MDAIQCINLMLPGVNDIANVCRNSKMSGKIEKCNSFIKTTYYNLKLRQLNVKTFIECTYDNHDDRRANRMCQNNV